MKLLIQRANSACSLNYRIRNKRTLSLASVTDPVSTD